MGNLGERFFSFIFVFAVSISAGAAASDYGVVFGFRSQSGDLDTTLATTTASKAAIGYQLGVTTSFQMSGALNFRTGLMYMERPMKISSTTGVAGEADIKLTYFDVPALLSFKFEDYAAIYGGVNLSLNLSKSMSGTGSLANSTVNEVKSMLVPIVLGAAFRFAPQIGADVFFETVPGETAQYLKSYRAVGVNLLYFF